MPELPDITVYLEALETRILGQTLNEVRLFSPFLLRTAVPPIQWLSGRRVIALRRLGKRIAIGFEDELWLVLHLMIAGRLHWLAAPAPVGEPSNPAAPNSARGRGVGKRPKLANRQAELEFNTGALMLTEAGTKRRASLHLVEGKPALEMLNPGGLEVMGSSLESFALGLKRENHTLKRALTDPLLFSGIGNAYADEILHRARLSPVALTSKLSPEQIAQLHSAVQQTLADWTQRLRQETGDAFPERVTAFRAEMAVHGKFGQPCSVCSSKVQRIRYAENETNYCPKRQTGGRLLADRSLSLLLKRDWPKTPAELDDLRARPV